MTKLVNSQQDDKPLVFVHIPKTGGLTLRAILGNFFDHNDICPLADWDEVLKRRLNLAYYQFFNGHFPYSVSDWLPQDPLYITMLREPVERVVSQYHHEKREESAGMYALVNGQDMSLDEFLHHPTATAGSQNWQTADIAAPPIEDLYADWCDFRDQLTTGDLPTHPRYRSLGLDTAQARLSEFAFVGLTDHFTESVMLLYYKFGWFPVLDFPSYNVKVGKRYRDELAPETVDYIETLHADDVALYAQGKVIFETEFEAMRQDLVERYGSAQDARETPDNDRLGELLQQDYQARYTERHEPLRHYRFAMHQPLDGIGWHPTEMHPEYGGVRWTGSHTRSLIDVPITYDGDLELSCHVLMALADDILDSLVLRANGHLLDLAVHENPDKTLLLKGIIPAEFQQSNTPFLRLEFIVKRTMQPDPNDPRRVGVLVHWLNIQPRKIIPAENRGHLMTTPQLSQEPVFFMQLPGTVDLSFLIVLENQFKAEAIYHSASVQDWQMDGTPELTQYAYIRGHFPYAWTANNLPTSTQYLTMLGEPVERTVMHLNQQQEHPDFPGAPANFGELSFVEILDDAALNRYFVNQQTAMLSAELSNDGLLGHDRLDVDLAKDRLTQYTFFGLVERWQESLFLLAYQFNWMPVWRHAHWSLQAPRPRWQKLAPELVEQLQTLNQTDTELYRFAVEIFDRRYREMGQALLAEYGSAEQANLTHPLPYQVVYDLLMRKFNAEVMQHTPASSAIYYDFADVMHGTGWHWREGETFRWMSEKQASLYLPNLESVDGLLSLYVAQVVSLQTLASLQVYINNIPVDIVRHRTPDDGYIVEAFVPEDVLGANPYYNTLRLDIQQTQVLPDSDDKRELGLAVSRIELIPASFAEIPVILEGWRVARHHWETFRAALEARIQALEDYSTSLNEELQKYQGIVQNSAVEIDALQTEINKYQDELHTAEEYVQSLAQHINEQNQQINEQAQHFHEAQNYALSLKQELDKVTAEFKKAEEYAFSLQRELDRFRR